MIAAGRLRSRINIEQHTVAQDALGQPLGTWELVAAVWADIAYPSGLSAIKAGADVSIIKASIRIRYRSGLNAGMRVVFGTTIFNIESVLPNPREGHVDLICEVVA